MASGLGSHRVQSASDSAPQLPAGKRIPTCTPCRERHLKCNKERPVCTNCRRAKHERVCTYQRKGQIRFRQGKIPHRPSQPRPRESAPHHDADQDLRRCPSPSPVSSAVGLGTRVGADASSEEAHDRNHAPWGARVVDPTETDRSARDARGRLGDFATPQAIADRDAPQSAPLRLLTDRKHCDIFAFYTNSLGFWLDIGSPSHYFQRRVPQLALSEPLLFYACLACSSHVLALRGKSDPATAEYLIAKVLEILIPLLSSEHATVSNEALLATTVILRMSEQFSETDEDFHRHLSGAASLFNDGTCWALEEINLATASFWTHLRELVRVCFLHEKPSQRMGLHGTAAYNADDMRPGASDEAWTNQMTLLLLRVINLCWGNAIPDDAFDEIERQVDEWKAAIPVSFRPWCCYEGEECPFPRMQCFESWHVVAWQFYYVAKAMLSVYSVPEHPRQSLYEIRRRLDTDVVVPARLLCGLCISSTGNLGTTLNGTHLMAWAGQFLQDRTEQRYLVRFLTEFGDGTQWPIRSSLQRLMERWEIPKAGSGLRLAPFSF